MSIATIFSYLIGNRAAILRIASARGAVWVGALLVLSAGLAREYDAADLIHEPWRLLIPFVASLATSFLLFCLVYLATLRRSVSQPAFGPAYVSFLSLYWLTAPLAWLYAVPVERLLPAGDATLANLYLLAAVSLWRVALMTRVLHVLFGARHVAAFFLVMLFADTVALVILFLTPVPIFNVMGGIRLSQSESVIQGAALIVGFFGVVSWLIWFFGACGVATAGKRNWKPQLVEAATSTSVGWPVWSLAVIAILGWGFVLPFTQPEQRLRYAVETNLTQNRVAGAIQLMSQHQLEDFPPQWVPPPHLAYANPRPPLLDVLEATLDEDCAPWVRSIFLEKLEAELSNCWSFRREWSYREASEKDRLLSVLERLPEGIAIVSRHQPCLARLASVDDGDLRAKLLALLARAGYEPSKVPDPDD